MRIVFMGTPDFAVPALQRIANDDQGFDIVLVVTGKDKPRRKKSTPPEPTPLKRAALELGLPVYETDDPSDPEFAATVASVMPDVIVVAAFRILPAAVYTLARLGAFNLHASLLPAYRGAAPVNWAIIRGESVTGVTTFFLQEKVDTGNIILMQELAIAPDDNATMLAGKLALAGAELVVETLRKIVAGNVVLRTQDDRFASRAPKLTRENTRIRWNTPAAAVSCFVRGLAMKPSAWTTIGERVLKIFRAVPCGAASGAGSCEPGRVLIHEGRFLVGTLDGWIEVLQLQLEGKKIMDASEFLRGFRQEEYPSPLVLS
ncbi:MAG: methionyl-tRNA formyltransferase [Chlorobi bacterium]|nr:methionyl-tRNA formyltransferase [Chlorobiota bacterium]